MFSVAPHCRHIPWCAGPPVLPNPTPYSAKPGGAGDVPEASQPWLPGSVRWGRAVQAEGTLRHRAAGQKPLLLEVPGTGCSQVWLSRDNRASKDELWEQCPKAESGGHLGHLVSGVQGQTGLPDQGRPLAGLGAGHIYFRE